MAKNSKDVYGALGKPKMRSRREVEKAYETAGGEAKDALGWVLGK